jgi:hypothetical protein
MTDSYGATSLPLTAISDPELESLADPARAHVLAFCKAVIEYECEEAWLALCPNEPIVRRTRNHNPQQEDFSDNDLPALFAWRGDLKPQYFQDEHWGDESNIELLWVFPPTPILNESSRRSIAVGLSRALHKAFGPLNGRHPSWVVSGDTDPFAATYGSSLITHGSFVSIDMDGSVRSADMMVEIAGRKVEYSGIYISLKCREDFVPGDVPTGSLSIGVIQRSVDGLDGFTQYVDESPAIFPAAFDEAFA